MKNICLVMDLLLLIGCKKSSVEQEYVISDPLEAGWNNEPVCEVLEENTKLRILKCTFPPGVGHDRHYHPAHFGYTLVGGTFSIKDTTGTREVNVPSGSHFYNEKIEWHEVLNVGETTAIFLIM